MKKFKVFSDKDFKQEKHEKFSKYFQTGNCMCPIAAEGRVSNFIFLVEAGGGGSLLYPPPTSGTKFILLGFRN